MPPRTPSPDLYADDDSTDPLVDDHHVLRSSSRLSRREGIDRSYTIIDEVVSSWRGLVRSVGEMIADGVNNASNNNNGNGTTSNGTTTGESASWRSSKRRSFPVHVETQRQLAEKHIQQHQQLQQHLRGVPPSPIQAASSMALRGWNSGYMSEDEDEEDDDGFGFFGAGFRDDTVAEKVQCNWDACGQYFDGKVGLMLHIAMVHMGRGGSGNSGSSGSGVGVGGSTVTDTGFVVVPNVGGRV
ncbi:hypothetical protein HK100_010833 [Physocladia obscura]|uniref:C2H2-type domain-containing protein n=1 Tax=Physocladia obscura TaxID=109957 RepID=A0AAD5T1Z4_9FUNG|nr:hypothetical protein HK100_010833 [Physocladia obscura]